MQHGTSEAAAARVPEHAGHQFAPAAPGPLLTRAPAGPPTAAVLPVVSPPSLKLPLRSYDGLTDAVRFHSCAQRRVLSRTTVRSRSKSVVRPSHTHWPSCCFDSPMAGYKCMSSTGLESGAGSRNSTSNGPIASALGYNHTVPSDPLLSSPMVLHATR